MAANKKERVQHIIQKNISNIIQNEIKDQKLGFVTITDVRITNDLSIATIYVNFLGSDNRNEAGLKILEKSKGFIRSKLAKELTIRKMPELKFVVDTSLEEGNKIDDILRSLKKDND
jgi:ribosome-binding factor A